MNVPTGRVAYPGLPGGPCRDCDCGHPSCEQKRRIAESTCTDCGEPIMFLFPYFMCLGDAGDAVFSHADCADVPQVIEIAGRLGDDLTV